MNTLGSFQCYCTPGYAGTRCDLDIDECLSHPCKNNATCHNLINNYECDCPPGYRGKDCSIDVDECEPKPCRNGGTCIDGINDFNCVCPEGLTGKLCQTNIDDCAVGLINGISMATLVLTSFVFSPRPANTILNA